jgi:hypothetical protein
MTTGIFSINQKTFPLSILRDYNTLTQKLQDDIMMA